MRTLPDLPAATQAELHVLFNGYVGAHAGRRRVLAVASLIVPGHGAPFTPTPATPR